MANEGSQLPGWIVLACEELRVFGIFELVTKCISELQPNIYGLYSQTLARIAEGDDEVTMLLRRALKCVLLTRFAMLCGPCKVPLANGAKAPARAHSCPRRRISLPVAQLVL